MSFLFQNCESNGSFGASNNISWNGMFRSTVQATPVLKDKLLTDSMIRVNGEFPPTVSNEHSYSLGRTSSDSLTGNGAASDGDSIPESPLSLHDGNWNVVAVVVVVDVDVLEAVPGVAVAAVFDSCVPIAQSWSQMWKSLTRLNLLLVIWF